MNFNWADLAFASKKPLDALRATFIAAPRQLSPDRFKQLVKQYLPHGNIVLGLATEPHILGLENQPQFTTLQESSVAAIINKVNSASPKHHIHTLTYPQRDLPHLLEKLDFQKAVFVRGSWYHAFHLRPEFYTLTNRRLAYEFVSPFASETEAQTYAQAFDRDHPLPAPDAARIYTGAQMIELAAQAARRSFAYSEHQAGVALGRQHGAKYRLVATAHNRIVPYNTFAMHHGASREQNFSPPGDLNHYDANHAEIELLTRAASNSLDLAGTTLFINLLPCPTCARMLTATPIAEFIYQLDHSDGYAFRLLTAAGKTVRRV